MNEIGASGSSGNASGRRPPRAGALILRLRRLGERHDEIDADLRELYRQRLEERGRLIAASRYVLDCASLWMHRRSDVTGYSKQREGGRAKAAKETAAPQRVGARGSRPGGPSGPFRTRRPRLLDGLLLDLKFALRMFRQQPRVASVTAIGLALAVGVCTVVFGVVNILALQPLGVPEADSVVRLRMFWSRGWALNWPHAEYLRLRRDARLTTLEGELREGAALGDDGSVSVPVALVSGGYFETLGVGAALGRMLSHADNEPGAPPVVVVNHTYWRTSLGADASIVGRQVRLLGMPFTVVGVVESGFGGVSRGSGPPTFWAPLSLAVEGRVWRPEPTPDLSISVLGRLAEDTEVAAAEAELSSLAAEVVAARPTDEQLAQVRVAAEPVDGGLESFGSGVVTFFAILAALVSLVLVLASANVANLLLAGALSRRQEVGVRLALGASRARLVRQLLTESLVLGSVGGIGGLLMASWLLPLLAASVDLPASFDTRPDLNVFLFVVAVTLGASLLAGLAPARFGARGDLSVHLKGAPLAAGLRTGRVRSLLVGVQAAGSIVLLVLAALLTRAFVQVSGTDLGFDVDRLAAVSPRFGASGYDAPRALAYWSEVVARVGSMPGVERVAVAEFPPFNQRFAGRRFVNAIDGVRSLYWHRISAGYFETVGIPLVRGRSFTADEVAAGARVAVISERLAEIAWQGDDPLGATLERVSTPALGGEDGGDIRIVGIVADAVVNRLDEPDAPAVYLPLSPADALLGNLVVRAAGDGSAITAAVLEAVRAIDPRVLPTAMPLTVGVQNALAQLRTVASGGAFLGAIALALAVTGVFGLTAVAVEQRTGEIGVRVAMGAQARDVVRLMLRDSLRPVLVGSGLGLLIALAGGRVLTSFLYGISEHDPLALASAVLILAGAAALASLLPARRAARVDPAKVLRNV